MAAGSSWGNAGWLTPALTLPLSEPSALTYGLKAMFDLASPLYIPLSAKPSLIRFLLGFARQCTPGKWREAKAVFSEIGAIGLDAFDELAEGSTLTPSATGRAVLGGGLRRQWGWHRHGGRRGGRAHQGSRAVPHRVQEPQGP